MAIYEGLCVALSHRFLTSIIYSDSRTTVDLMCGPEGHSDKYFSILYVCRKLWKQVPEVRIVYGSRVFNQVADAVAKHSTTAIYSRNVTRTFSLPPSYCMDIVMDDCKNLFNMVM